ncbi:MAG: hypothetical protein ABSG43_22425 [Solirubrobacteraceae bacterium]|jgi:hypothetical protein
MSATLERLEAVIDTAGIARRIELLLPIGVRPRQLTVRTLLLGMLLITVQGRPAHLRRVHQALTALAAHEHQRLGIIADWNTGPHLLTYRQTERTFGLVIKALSLDTPDGTPSETLSEVLDALLEASVQVLGEHASSSYAVDWTDHETWSCPPPKPRAANPEPAASDPKPQAAPSDAAHDPDPEHRTPADDNDDHRCADPEASWGHRRGNHPGQKDELFYGYYLQAATTVKDEHGPQVPELARRMLLTSCDHDPPAALVPVLARMKASGITLADVLADSGYAYRVPETWALPVRALGAQLIQDLHPNDRGPHGTHHGAIQANGRLYCPATPRPLLDIGPLARAATPEQTAAHDQRSGELARYKLSPITSYDRDGYHRVICPATQGKLRCPHRPASLTLPHDRPTIPDPPEHPPACCSQQTITVPPSINAKTAQKHDYPSAAHRHSYARRSSAERTFSTIKDPATNDTSRGWCRITGLTGIALFTASVLIARNLRIADAFNARQAENQRRAANRLPPKQRRRRRTTTEQLTNAANTPP